MVGFLSFWVSGNLETDELEPGNYFTILLIRDIGFLSLFTTFVMLEKIEVYLSFGKTGFQQLGVKRDHWQAASVIKMTPGGWDGNFHVHIWKTLC